MIEDDYLDVLGKAMHRHGLSERELVSQAGIDTAEWNAFTKRIFSEPLARACARVLDLNEDAYAELPAYHPDAWDVLGIRQLELPFGSYGVNTWWLEQDGVAVLMDTGCTASDLADVLPRVPEMVCITHGHHDHVGGIGHFRSCPVTVHAAGGVAGAQEIIIGQALACGPMAIETLDVSGHFTPSVAYLVRGFERPVMVVGDALFAGSMGKCASPKLYRMALENLKQAFNGQPDELVILPGHGPATTLGEERRSNPFLR